MTLILLASAYFSFGQKAYSDTIYYDIENNEVSKDSAFTVRYIKYDSSRAHYLFSDFYIFSSHGFIQSGELKSLDPEVKDGYFTSYDKFGYQKTTLYKNDQFVKIVSYQNQMKGKADPVYEAWEVEKAVGYKHGFNSLMDTIMNYSLENMLPENISKSHLILEFIVETDSTTSNFIVIKSIDDQFDEKVIDLLKKLSFIPAQHNGIAVRSSFTIPIRFCFE